MEWNVFYHDVNRQVIEKFNIFDHYTFNKNVKNLLNKCKNKDEFAEELERELMYYFWCKSEYEVIISSWCGGRNTKDIKVDIYTQVMNNWDIFLDYVWSNKWHRENNKAGREYVKETGKCPMCEDCPDNCPMEEI